VDGRAGPIFPPSRERRYARRVATRVLTVGETMALLDPAGSDVANGTGFTLRVGGAESNFAIALSRLGIPVTWVSRLGTDPFGDLVATTLAGEGVDLRYVARDPERPTGVYFKTRENGTTQVHYYRAGSAASRLAPDDVPDAALDGVALVHLTGITTALGDGPRQLVLDLARRARARGATVVVDPNYRPALWTGADVAAAVLLELLPSADWFLAGLDECRRLFGASSPAGAIDAVTAAGAGGAAIRIAERGAVVVEAGELVEVAPERIAAVVDEVGAGDGFAAGFAYGLLHGWSPRRCAAAGNLIAAAALGGPGDWETYPRLEEVEDLLESSD
jgi:2-dehydro-3-deoxygluconokinase